MWSTRIGRSLLSVSMQYCGSLLHKNAEEGVAALPFVVRLAVVAGEATAHALESPAGAERDELGQHKVLMLRDAVSRQLVVHRQDAHGCEDLNHLVVVREVLGLVPECPKELTTKRRCPPRGNVSALSMRV